MTHMPHSSLWAVSVKYSPVLLLQESGGLMEREELRNLLCLQVPWKKGPEMRIYAPQAPESNMILKTPSKKFFRRKYGQR